MNKSVFSALGLLALLASMLPAQLVRFSTNLGDMDVTLLPESAPATVQNFLNYVNRGDYNNTFVHRSVKYNPDAGSYIGVIQGGGYRWENGQAVAIRADAAVPNEFKVSNARGTIAMAKLSNGPDTATNQWFFNVVNNSSSLNTDNGGYTVFGRIANAAGLTVMDRIGAIRTYAFSSPFGQFPLLDFTEGATVTEANLIVLKSITIVDTTPAVLDHGIISASGYGALPFAAAGSYIEIYGSYLAGTTRAWSTADFHDGDAPTALSNVSVTVDGRPAYVYSISPGQVNVQVPAGVTANTSVPVVVTYANQTSAPASLAIKETAGGLLAPASFKVGGRQYVTAIHNSGGAFVSNGTIPNIPSAPARPGEILILYGVGFGPVTPGPVAGRVATGQPTINAQIQFQFGDVNAQVRYAGLVPGLVGLYQFNVVVPTGLPAGDVTLKVLVDGNPISQALYIPVQP
jgi:uncharacterized protein (TIGR03437 family)